ncbi:acyl-CoA dehydrogenase [Nocardioides humilatus]|uniref:Acyl-CoA dehydrogenase n=1 Tax=Nocardioides humilatus TaxID=2607660 RepID=A0A5B1LMT4_9ACTN|nr:acyl-CoA dehydrogenase [Nocardioides humilatus]KAA1420939.1 acyl-CoA dehydrogenase [Nocardioides humilatus]
MSVLMSRRDLEFLLYEWLDVEQLTLRERYTDHSRDTFDAALELAASIATEHFAPHNKLADANEPTFDGERVHLIPEVAKALDVYWGSGLMTATMDEAVGGGQLPHVVASALMSWFQAANVGTSGYPFLTMANANLLLAHGSPEQVETWVRPMLEGRYFGTMCLSEPGAGSSLADVATRAEPQPDGTYRLFGNKMWISGGEHDLSDNIVHLVLARVSGAPEGVKGLSLFIVPKVLADGTRNDVTLAGLNHKMGYRGTVNTLLNFGEKSGAVGDLVGEEGRGLACMFHMMNEARIGVGLGAVALGYTGYLKSLQYAKERVQGRPAGSADPVAIVEHADVKRMLLAQKSYVEGALALLLFCSRLVDEEKTADTPEARDAAHLLLDVLTPIAKSWPSQWCLAANDLAIQVHGGYGYTRDYDVEQHYRDNRLNPIHEGTHGIQGQDLLGRKVIMQGGAGLMALVAAIEQTLARADDHEHAVALRATVERIVEVTQAIWAPADPALGLANASLYLEAVGHAVIAWMWLEQVLAAEGKVGDFYDGKRAASSYFFRYELPRTGPQLDLLAALDRTTLDTWAEWL